MLETLKIMLSIKDDSKDALLEQIINICKAPILSYINEKTLPSELEWILIEMSIIRFNRLNSEGLASESIDGGSVSFVQDVFGLYKSDLNNYIANKNAVSRGATFYEIG